MREKADRNKKNLERAESKTEGTAEKKKNSRGGLEKIAIEQVDG